MNMTRETTPDNSEDLIEYELTAEQTAALADSTAAQEAQQAAFAAEEAARWETLNAAMKNCEEEMQRRDKEYRRAMEAAEDTGEE